LQAIGTIAVAQDLLGPAQAQMKPQPHFIFFNHGDPNLVPSAKRLIDALKSAIKKNAHITIGNCDTSEPNPNMLGMARAMAVLKALTGSDLPAGVQLTVASKGSVELTVKTAANVKEPQNRRVAITIA
jgi:outer membrane protein OmpA-like peptidoglycan-associated protein